MGVRRVPDHEFDIGEWARDAHPPDPDEPGDEPLVLVVDALDQTADEAVVFEEPNGKEHTVADYNDGKWPDSPVVTVVYKESLDYRLKERFPEWTVDDVLDLYDSGVLTEGQGTGGYGLMAYSMPEARLKEYTDE